MASETKARYWSTVVYPENMPDDWKETIGDKLQIPYAYCEHNKDKDKDGNIRKTHAHIILAFGNTTTKNAALKLVQGLTADGKPPCTFVIEQVHNIKHAFDYLIHNTEDCKKKKKYQYDSKERVTGNGFDIGSYEQLSVDDKNKMAMQICNLIRDQEIYNFVELFDMVSGMGMQYFDILKSYSGLFSKMCDGVYQKVRTRVQAEAEAEAKKKLNI